MSKLPFWWLIYCTLIPTSAQSDWRGTAVFCIINSFTRNLCVPSSGNFLSLHEQAIQNDQLVQLNVMLES